MRQHGWLLGRAHQAPRDQSSRFWVAQPHRPSRLSQPWDRDFATVSGEAGAQLWGPRKSARSLKAISWGSLASMKSQTPGAHLRSSASLPSLSRLVTMKMNGPAMTLPCLLRIAIPNRGSSGSRA